MLSRDAYLSLRKRYEPKQLRLVIIAESPPVSGNYFYKPEAALGEPLFAAIMRQIDFAPRIKADDLNELRHKGWLLVDATYQPINDLPRASRDAVIERDYPLLRGDLANLLPDRTVPLVLIKANVCRVLEPLLLHDGFNVLNHGRAIYFPGSGRQKQFQHQFAAVF